MARYERLLACVPDGFVVDRDDGLAGVVAVHSAGAIPFLVVDPVAQGRGIGSRLLAHAIQHLAGSGAVEARLGSGGAHYLWPGVPRDLPEALRFFLRRGWRQEHVATDLIQELRRFVLPSGTLARAAAARVSFTLCTADVATEVVAYEEREHPQWLEFLRRRLSDDPSSVVVGRGADGQVVAACSMDIPPRFPCRWSRALGDDAGEIGCVGVARSRNGEGIGTALMAFATEQLRSRGARTGYLSWTVRRSFYGYLGYRPWRDYQMATRSL